MKIPVSKMNKLKNDLKGCGLSPVLESLKESGTKTTLQSIYNVLNRRSSNDEILKELIKYRDKLAKNKRKIIESI